MKWDGARDLKTATPNKACLEGSRERSVTSATLGASKRRSRRDSMVLLCGASDGLTPETRHSDVCGLGSTLNENIPTYWHVDDSRDMVMGFSFSFFTLKSFLGWVLE